MNGENEPGDGPDRIKERLDKLKELVGPDVESGIEAEESARKEERFLTDKQRKGEKKDAFHRITIWAMWVMFVAAALLVLFRGVHLLLPADSMWLAESSIGTIDGLIENAVAALFGVIASHFLQETDAV